MAKFKMAFLDAYTTNPGDISFEPFASLGELKVYDRTTTSELAERVAGCEVIIVNKFLVNDTTLDLMPDVKYIVVAATGYNNIDLPAVQAKGIKVSNVTAYSTDAVTQYVFAAIFSLFNRLEYYDAEVKKSRWASCLDFCFYDHSIRDVHGLTLGILGYGHIGSKVAEVGNAFGMYINVHTRDMQRPKPDYVHFVNKEDLFANSDILTLHCPLTPQTRDVINKDNMIRMKSDAIIINTGRGALVNESDLLYALDHGIIGGAAVDVLVSEPPLASHPLTRHPKCLVTPHIAWASKASRIKLVEGIVTNIKAYIAGNHINQVI